MGKTGTDDRFTVSVQTADFDITAETNALTRGSTQIGAVASFTGLVRGEGDGSGNKGGSAMHAMELEHYPGMTERALEDIVSEARSRWPLDGVRVVHRVGRLKPGEQIVLVLVASRHRKVALEAVEFIMDYLKTRAPFWKREEGPDGAGWVEARESDESAAGRWRK